MDLDGDGHIDVLSGSYSRREKNMAGLFQVLWGQKDGSFRSAEVLNGTDGQPLVIPASTDSDSNKICTRPFAADLDGDGKLDLVVGNMSGMFAFFHGEGGGKFAPQPTWLDGLKVDGHSDPCVVDWDGDGLLDIVSGSDDGGVFWFKNVGSRTEPRFAASQTLLPPAYSRHVHVTITEGALQNSELPFGDTHVTKPGRFTRVWVADVNGDGKLDLLVGDSWYLLFPNAGVSEAEARKAYVAQYVDGTRLELEGRFRVSNGQATEKEVQEAKAAREAECKRCVREESPGFVWVLYGK